MGVRRALARLFARAARALDGPRALAQQPLSDDEWDRVHDALRGAVTSLDAAREEMTRTPRPRSESAVQAELGLLADATFDLAQQARALELLAARTSGRRSREPSPERTGDG